MMACCKDCGESVPKGSKYCPNCGTSLQSDDSERHSSNFKYLGIQISPGRMILGSVILILLFIIGTQNDLNPRVIQSFHEPISVESKHGIQVSPPVTTHHVTPPVTPDKMSPFASVTSHSVTTRETSDKGKILKECAIREYPLPMKGSIMPMLQDVFASPDGKKVHFLAYNQCACYEHDRESAPEWCEGDSEMPLYYRCDFYDNHGRSLNRSICSTTRQGLDTEVYFECHIPWPEVQALARNEGNYTSLLVTVSGVGTRWSAVHNRSCDGAKLESSATSGWGLLPVCSSTLGNGGQLVKIGETNKKHFLSICLFITSDPYVNEQHRWIVGESVRRLVEWIEFHRLVGFDHFYVFDNSKRANGGILSILEAYIKDNIATYHHWPHQRCTQAPIDVWMHQIGAENSCARRYAYSSQWIADIDDDEFLVPNPELFQTVGDVVRNLTGRPWIAPDVMDKILYSANNDLQKEGDSEAERKDIEAKPSDNLRQPNKTSQTNTTTQEPNTNTTGKQPNKTSEQPNKTSEQANKTNEQANKTRGLESVDAISVPMFYHSWCRPLDPSVTKEPEEGIVFLEHYQCSVEQHFEARNKLIMRSDALLLHRVHYATFSSEYGQHAKPLTILFPGRAKSTLGFIRLVHAKTGIGRANNGYLSNVETKTIPDRDIVDFWLPRMERRIRQGEIYKRFRTSAVVYNDSMLEWNRLISNASFDPLSLNARNFRIGVIRNSSLIAPKHVPDLGDMDYLAMNTTSSSPTMKIIAGSVNGTSTWEKEAAVFQVRMDPRERDFGKCYVFQLLNRKGYPSWWEVSKRRRVIAFDPEFWHVGIEGEYETSLLRSARRELL
ncbi:hypothetical protein AAMO2058_000554200 [Amorphochlora amoebiformis]